ncbi:hypothetical protein BHE74_00014307 [Ensete ventricosum]|nr:hypothetical protein GW17_00028013 [Ensete ventricosum]RWW77531.1 hypothetical protein BHE74_00014307 [Ensete ventricosum]
METQWITELPHAATDKRPRKRPRLAWDVPPPIPPPMVLAPSFLLDFVVPLMLYCGMEAAQMATMNQHLQSFYYGGVPRYGSPPWRGDDKDGHYVFGIGENLTPRYRILNKMGEEASFPCSCGAVMHDLRLIHTDLKPENILLVSSEYIKVPDHKVIYLPLGSWLDIHNSTKGYITTGFVMEVTPGDALYYDSNLLYLFPCVSIIASVRRNISGKVEDCDWTGPKGQPQGKASEQFGDCLAFR